MALFEFTGTDPSKPAQYSIATGTVCPFPPEQMCTLEAADNGSGQPIITPALKDEIINCLQNQVNGPNVSLQKR